MVTRTLGASEFLVPSSSYTFAYATFADGRGSRPSLHWKERPLFPCAFPTLTGRDLNICSGRCPLIARFCPFIDLGGGGGLLKKASVLSAYCENSLVAQAAVRISASDSAFKVDPVDLMIHLLLYRLDGLCILGFPLNNPHTRVCCFDGSCTMLSLHDRLHSIVSH